MESEDRESQITRPILNKKINTYTKHLNEELHYLHTSDLNVTTESSKPPPENKISKRKAEQLRVLIVNFQSIRNKKEELEQILTDENIDIVLGSETHLNPSIYNNELLPPNYTCYRKDRTDGYGGVIIITKSDLIVEEIVNSKSCELIAVKIQTHQHPLVLATAYRPPNSPIDETKGICNEIRKLSYKYKNSPIWFGGDMNLPDIDWTTNTIINHQYVK